MKRKTWIGILSAVCALTACLGLTACKDDEASTPVNGVDGKSAYELYCQANPNYTGTLEEWLASLQGAQGAQGEKGETGAQGAQGEKGETGAQGAGIASVVVDENGKLVITLTDGTVLPPVDMPIIAGGETAESLRFKKIIDKEEYCVVGIGNISVPDIVVPSTYRGLPVTEIASETFEGEPYVRSIEIPTSIKKIGYIGAEDEEIAEVKYNGTLSQWMKIDIEDSLADEFDLYIGGEKLTEVTIPADITEIKKYIFAGAKSITKAIIPDHVTSIGYGAFGWCDSLTSVEIPDSVTSIGEYAFSWCDSLTSVVIGDSVTSIGDDAFSYCDSLTSVVIGDSVTSIGYGAFGWCDSLTSVEIGDSVTSIGDWAFSGCDSLTSVEIGDSVTSIGDYAFSGCDSLTSVYIDDIENWCGITFSDNGSNPLCYVANLYLNNELVTELVIPDSVTSIGDRAFCGCNSLTSVVIGDSVTSIGNSAFSGTALTSVVIGNSVTSIGDEAFYWCDSLTSVVIGDSVTSIGDWAFYHCDSLTSVYYKGTAEEWSEISIGYSNNALTNATRYYYSEGQPTEAGNWWYYVNGVPTVW